MQVNQVQVLKSSELCGRQFTVYGTPDEPLFKAKEVAGVIEHPNVTVMLNLVDEEEKGVKQLLTPGGNQQVWFLTEDGLYEVLMQSRKPIAKEFKKGVKEILKTIRKTGGYIATKEDDTPEEIMARALLVAQDTIKRKDERLKQLEADNKQKQIAIDAKTQENEVLKNTVSSQAPMVQYVSNTLLSPKTYTSTQIAKELGLRTANELHKKLKEWNVMFYQSGQWMLTAKYSGKNYTKPRTQSGVDDFGKAWSNTITVWTEEGRKFLHELFESKMSA